MHTNNEEYLCTRGSLDGLSVSFGSFYYGSRRMKNEVWIHLTTVFAFKLLIPELKITVLEIKDH